MLLGNYLYYFDKRRNIHTLNLRVGPSSLPWSRLGLASSGRGCLILLHAHALKFGLGMVVCLG